MRFHGTINKIVLISDINTCIYILVPIFHVYRYNPHTNKWTEVAPMAKRRAGVGLAALNGFLYAVGGFDDASPLETIER